VGVYWMPLGGGCVSACKSNAHCLREGRMKLGTYRLRSNANSRKHVVNWILLRTCLRSRNIQPHLDCQCVLNHIVFR